jgi:putative transposase
VSPRTVRKYLPRRPPGRPRGDLRWSTFLRLHAQGVIACDFLVAVTATFRLLYVFVVIDHRSRRLIHYNVTAHRSSAWTLQQLREAVGVERRYEYLLHDRDSIFAEPLDESVERLGIIVLKSPPRSPMANSICERVIGTTRRECLDWLVPLSESHLRSILRMWISHYGCRASAHGAGSGRSRSAAGLSQLPKASFAPSPRRIVRRRCPPDPWRAASRVFPRACKCVIEFLRTTAQSSAAELFVVN